MKLSVVIAHYQEPQRLVATIESIRETAPHDVEIVVVDDGGFYPEADGKAAIADFSEKDNILVIANTNRRGNAFCRTLGAKHATGDWLMFTDAHMVFEPKWFDRFSVYARTESPQTLFCGPYLSSREEWEGKREPDVFYGARHYYWEHNLPDGRQRDILGVLPLEKNSSFEIPAVVGANYFIAKEWFQKIGGLPCQTGWSVDEWPLSVKTWLAGGAVRLMPDVRVRHVLCKTGKGSTGYGKDMTQGQLLFNKLSVAYQTLPADIYNQFVAGLPLSPKSADLAEANKLMAKNQEQLDYWRSYLKGVFTRDVDWLCDKFDLAHPADIGAG